MKVIIPFQMNNRIITNLYTIKKEWVLADDYISKILPYLRNVKEVVIKTITPPCYIHDDFSDDEIFSSTFFTIKKEVVFYTDDLMFSIIRRHPTFTEIANNYVFLKQVIYDTILLYNRNKIDLEREEVLKSVQTSLVYLLNQYIGKYSTSVLFKQDISYLSQLLTEILLRVENCVIPWNDVYSKVSLEHSRKIPYYILSNIKSEQYKNILYILLKNMNINVEKEKITDFLSNHEMLSYLINSRIVSGVKFAFAMLYSRSATYGDVFDKSYYLRRQILGLKLFNKMTRQLVGKNILGG